MATQRRTGAQNMGMLLRTQRHSWPAVRMRSCRVEMAPGIQLCWDGIFGGMDGSYDVQGRPSLHRAARVQDALETAGRTLALQTPLDYCNALEAEIERP